MDDFISIPLTDWQQARADMEAAAALYAAAVPLIQHGTAEGRTVAVRGLDGMAALLQEAFALLGMED